MNILYKKFRPDFFEVCYEVHSPQNGMRLDQYMRPLYPSLSREQIKKIIKKDGVQIKKRPGRMRPNTKVYEKEQVVVRIERTIHEDEWWNGHKLDLDKKPPFLYEDSDLIILSKPAFMTTHPTGKHLFYCATVYCESQCEQATHSIHRLDRETSGILLVGKNPESARKFTMYFEKERVRKCYFFIAVENENYAQEEIIRARERLDTGGEGLLRVQINHYPEESIEGKRAETDFEILHREKGYLLGLAFPKTGRQHQIRVHALAHGFPLLGDKIYYGGYSMFQRFKDLKATSQDYTFMQLPRHALHAMGISLPWKKKGEGNSRRIFHCPLPKDMESWIKENLHLNYNQFVERVYLAIDNNFKDLT